MLVESSFWASWASGMLIGISEILFDLILWRFVFEVFVLHFKVVDVLLSFDDLSTFLIMILERTEALVDLAYVLVVGLFAQSVLIVLLHVGFGEVVVIFFASERHVELTIVFDVEVDEWIYLLLP